MGEAALLPVDRIVPLDAEGERRLAAVLGAAQRVFAAGAALPPVRRDALFAHAGTVFRRWSLEIVLIVHGHGEIGYGALSRLLGGVPSGSLSPKLRGLVQAGVLHRLEHGPQGGVSYRLTPGARAFADAVYVLTTAKALQHRHVTGQAAAPEAFRGTDPPADGHDAAVDRFAALARAFVAHHDASAVPAGHESPLATATRFTAACGRKWEGAVMLALLAGPAGFVPLRAATGAGDEALARALHGLVATGTVERLEDGGYRLTRFGWIDLQLGFCTVSLFDRVRSTDSAWQD